MNYSNLNNIFLLELLKGLYLTFFNIFNSKVTINYPFEKGFLSREDLRFQMTEWIDELPGEPCLLKF